MAQATFADYETWLSGKTGIIPEAEFDFWSKKAQRMIDNATFYSIYPDEYQQAVLDTCCALSESIYNNESPDAEKVITSEKVGNWSGSYAVAADSVEPAVQYDSLLNEYLGDTGLLFRGVCRHES